MVPLKLVLIFKSRDYNTLSIHVHPYDGTSDAVAYRSAQKNLVIISITQKKL